METKINFAGKDFTKLANKSWNDLFLEEILPTTAGIPENRNRISPTFMSAMADFQDEAVIPDELVDILLEIALQRISCGAVVHKNDPTPTFGALPEAFQAYASCSGYIGSEPGLMGNACYRFIINKLEACCNREALRKHALSICFGLSDNLTPEGEQRNDYMLGSSYFTPDGKKLRQLADNLILRYAPDDEIMRHWLNPEYWREHLDYFRNKYRQGELDMDKFMSILAPDNRPDFLKKLFRSKAEKAIFKALQNA